MSETVSSGTTSAQNLSNNDVDILETEETSSEEQIIDDYGQTEIEEKAIETNRILQERLITLRETMAQLKDKLLEEKQLWRREIEEVSKLNSLQESSSNLDTFETEEAADSLNSIDPDQDYLTINDSAKEFSISEYEQKLQKYQEALAKAQAEKRASLKRQIAISNYKRRLLEVENMCNLELLRVKQNVQFLQPLQMIASEWNRDTQDHGDDNTNNRKEITDSDESKPKELLPIENVGSKLYNDMSEIFTKCYNSNLSQFSSTSSFWPNDDDVMSMGTNYSPIW